MLAPVQPLVEKVVLLARIRHQLQLTADALWRNPQLRDRREVLINTNESVALIRTPVKGPSGPTTGRTLILDELCGYSEPTGRPTSVALSENST